MDARRLLILGMTLALALSGCGSSESTADKTFGETSGRDEELIADVTAEIKQFSSSYTDLVVAFNAEDVGDARTAVDAMAEHLDKASGTVADAENAELRTTYQDYLAKMDGVTAAADRVVEYLEAPGGAKPKLEDRLAAQYEDAVKKAQTADKELLDRLAKNASPEERERLQQQYRELERQFEERTGG